MLSSSVFWWQSSILIPHSADPRFYWFYSISYFASHVTLDTRIHILNSSIKYSGKWKLHRTQKNILHCLLPCKNLFKSFTLLVLKVIPERLSWQVFTLRSFAARPHIIIHSTCVWLYEPWTRRIIIEAVCLPANALFSLDMLMLTENHFSRQFSLILYLKFLRVV